MHTPKKALKKGSMRQAFSFRQTQTNRPASASGGNAVRKDENYLRMLHFTSRFDFDISIAQREGAVKIVAKEWRDIVGLRVMTHAKFVDFSVDGKWTSPYNISHH